MYLDTSVLIRYITRDDPQKADQFEKFIKNQKDHSLILTEVIAAEIYWTLLSFYKFKKNQILKVFDLLLKSPKIDCNGPVLTKTFSLLKNKNISFIDAHTAASALDSKSKTVISYDQDFDKIPALKRLAP